MWGKASMKAAELRMIDNQWFEGWFWSKAWTKLRHSFWAKPTQMFHKQNRAGAFSSGPVWDGFLDWSLEF